MEMIKGIVEICEPTSDEINIMFAGDYYPGRRAWILPQDGEPLTRSLDLSNQLKQKDISIVNLECPLTDVDNPIQKVGPHLKADPSNIKLLQYYGFDVVSLANNHIMDHGVQGLEDTLSVCEKAGIKTVGAGHNLLDAGKPLIVDVRSYKIAFINLTENEFSIATKEVAGANPINPIVNYRQIIELRADVDLIFMIIHGGNEYYQLPSPQMVELYRYYADLGVTAIIGHHPHCASGFEIHHGVPIFYSLGNFVFNSPHKQNEDWYWGYCVRITIGRTGVSRITIVPYTQSTEPFDIRFMDDEEGSRYLDVIKGYSEIIADTELLEHHWRIFCESRKHSYVKNLLGLNRVQMACFKRGLLPRFVLNKSKATRLLNLIRCEAHRAVSIETLMQLHAMDE